MSDYFLDSSALVKRYLTETGSDWVRALADPGTGNTIVVAGITRVEVAAALAGRHRAPDGVSLFERDAAVYLLLEHFEMEYGIAPLDPEIIGRAVPLTQTHYLPATMPCNWQPLWQPMSLLQEPISRTSPS